MPWVRHVDLQKGQFDTQDKNYPLPLPCILVEIKPTTWLQNLQKVQLGDTTVSLSLYLDHSSDSLRGSGGEEESLKLMDLMDEIYQKISDLYGPLFKRLVRTTDQVTAYKQRMIVFRTDFTTTLWDERANSFAQLPAEPEIITTTI